MDPRLIDFYDCPAEQKAVVQAMCALVERVDPEFFKKIVQRRLGGSDK